MDSVGITDCRRSLLLNLLVPLPCSLRIIVFACTFLFLFKTPIALLRKVLFLELSLYFSQFIFLLWQANVRVFLKQQFFPFFVIFEKETFKSFSFSLTMDVSVVLSVGSFFMSERVLKPKATLLSILGCILIYDLTTKTHDVASLRAYRGKENRDNLRLFLSHSFLAGNPG